MGKAAKSYIYSVIAAGGCVLAVALVNWSSPDPLLWAIYLLLAVAASVVKLRLPGMDGTYSFSFLFLLYGIAHFSLAETLLAGCAGAVAQSLLNAKKRSSPIQVLFNTANVTVSVGACFLIARAWSATGMAQYRPATMAVVACTYFIVNTVLVSGVLSVLERKPLGEVCGQWYVWSFPYYLVGVALVGLFPSPGQAAPGEAWLILLPLIYLVHFFLGLLEWHASSPAAGNQANAPLPRVARMYIASAVTAGAILLAAAAFNWQSENPARFISYLALAVAGSTLKIRLPHTRGTLTPAFVLVLAAIAQLNLAETVIMAAAAGLVQVLWRPAVRPSPAQVLFSPASLSLSAAAAHSLCRVVLEPWLGHSVVGVLVVSALVMYGSNTLMVAMVLALVNRKPLSSVWQLCYFWSLPYYLVGAAAAGIMAATNRTADWPPSLLVLPLMGLVYVSYRAQLRQAVERSGQAMA
jgi:hypothetical protein